MMEIFLMHLGPPPKQDWVIWNIKIWTEIPRISAEASCYQLPPLHQWQAAPTSRLSTAVPPMGTGKQLSRTNCVYNSEEHFIIACRSFLKLSL